MSNMKITNLQIHNGNPVPNQFNIETDKGTFFQSYETIIAFKPRSGEPIQLDSEKWNCSRTTSKYRALWLDETTKQTEQKIKAGIYKLTNLNK